MDFGTIDFKELQKDPALQAGFLDLYQKTFGEPVCGKCPGSLEKAFVRYRQKLYFSNTQNESKMSISKYKLKGTMIRLHNGDAITLDNITDAKVEDLVTRCPALASRFTMADGSPFKLKGVVTPQPEPEVEPVDTVNATRSAIEFAEKNGIDINTVTGTGKDGKVSLRDVKQLV